MSAAEASASISDDLKFEEAIERLEGIVRRMEEERIPLDELIRDYETGSRLLGICKSRVASARERVEVISKSLADGESRLEAFESGGDDAPTGGGEGDDDSELL